MSQTIEEVKKSKDKVDVSLKETIQKLEEEIGVLSQEIEDKKLILEALQQKVEMTGQEISQLTTANDPLQAEMLAERNMRLKSMNEQIISLQNTVRVASEKIQHNKNLLIEHSFQIDLEQLWNQEAVYGSLLDDSGKTTAELLLERQGYDSNNETCDRIIQAYGDDYQRLGNSEVVQLFRSFSVRSEHSRIFEIAQKKYAETQEDAYGLLLATCYQHGFGTEKSKKKALKINQTLMQRGFPLATYAVACEYQNGILLPQDIQKAREYFSSATTQDQFYTPHYRWGAQLLQGVGLEQVQGLVLLYTAAKNGQANAAMLLAGHHFTNRNLTGAGEKAYFYAKLSADLNSSSGMVILAGCYAGGIGVPQDLQQYLVWLNKSMELGCTTAAISLATHYLDGFAGIRDVDYEKSLSLLFKAVRQDYEMLKDFQSLVERYKQNSEFRQIAFKYCLQCLEGHLLDHSRDSVVMGALYLEGIFVDKDWKLAAKCFAKAAAKGEAGVANFIIALYKKNGLGPIAPSLLYKLANDTNDPKALTTLRTTLAHYTPLLETLRTDWQWVDQEENKQMQMPDEICQLVADYAFQDPSVDEDETAKSGVAKLERKAS